MCLSDIYIYLKKILIKAFLVMKKVLVSKTQDKNAKHSKYTWKKGFTVFTS